MRDPSTRQPVERATRLTDWSKGWAASGAPFESGEAFLAGCEYRQRTAAVTTVENTTVLRGAGTTGRCGFTTGGRPVSSVAGANPCREAASGRAYSAIARLLGLDAHQPFADRPQRKLRTRREPKLVENVRDMRTRRSLANPELPRNLFVCPPFADECDDIEFPRSERSRRTGSHLKRGHESSSDRGIQQKLSTVCRHVSPTRLRPRRRP
jgi:hypothetical protein